MSRTAKSFVKVHQALSTNGNPSRKQARLALWGTILGDDTKAAVVEEIFSLLTSSSAHDETSSTASSCPSDVDELAPSGASVSRGDQKAETYTATGSKCCLRVIKECTDADNIKTILCQLPAVDLGEETKNQFDRTIQPQRLSERRC